MQIAGVDAPRRALWLGVLLHHVERFVTCDGQYGDGLPSDAGACFDLKAAKALRD
jgi:hypothetical protein